MSGLAVRDGPAQADARDWPVTNCYIDAWLPLLRSWQLEPLAALGVTVALDYEGDQFTFFKFAHDDLERFYGIVAGELSIWRPLEEQLVVQMRLGRATLVEVDGFYLPDTRATSYRIQHMKTTIAVEAIDPRRMYLRYYHNDGRYELEGADYDGVFRHLPHQDSEDLLPPYVEFVKRCSAPLRGRARLDAAVESLRRRLGRRPEHNPIARYRRDFSDHMEWLTAHREKFHEYAFVIFRQLGPNFELLASHLDWLSAQGVSGLVDACESAARISATAKAMQFKVARIASRRRFDPCDAMFDQLQRDYAMVMELLARAVV
jgi:hypothetical protein